MRLFEMRDFAPPKPAHAEGCIYCREDDDGNWTSQNVHEGHHLPITCGVCGETSPNRLLFEMNHGGRSWIAPVKCTTLFLRLNHLTFALLHGEKPHARDQRALDLGWRIAPDGAQLPPPDWDDLHPPMGSFPHQIYAAHKSTGQELK